MSAVATTAAGLENAGADSLLGLAALGKTALALALVIGLIVLCSWLLRRLGSGRQWPGQHLRVIGSSLLGPRERVVIVEVRGTWLVLGVTGQQISKLHELPAPPTEAGAGDARPAGGFAERFAGALSGQLKQQLPGHKTGNPERP
ncbi:flagellar biosynthetic protein FliO [Azotobacter chroococcum]|uniref:Flagellar protein n=1 Tax=Azotobacter chroococcum TaxID=353 RepID=A0AAP9YFU0_9GAMM|nr:flagellar biosynthetic protein FliO [Azotobacter chroococcum]QQE90545.1 flagellar biosynthetic protein FliO [Azotobacter chroococcum]